MPKMNFAHLLGMRPAAAKADESDEDKKKREEDEKDKAAAKGKAEGKPDDQGDDESDEDYEERKKKEREDEDKKDDDDDAKDAKARAARGRERARCAAIFGSKAAGSRPDMAAYFAFETSMSRNAAVDALNAIAAGSPPPAAAAGPGRSLDRRMAAQPQRPLGDGGGASPEADSPEAIGLTIAKAAGLAPTK